MSASTMRVSPMRLLRIPEPFDRPDFVYEPKIDGFRALAHIRRHRCELVSRNGHVFRSWPTLAVELAQTVRCRSAILDGEICCLNSDGGSDFYRLLFRREQPYFYAFDVLMIDGKDVRALPLLERKRRLVRILPRVECRLLYLDHIAQHGRDLYRIACDRDLEGIVAKWARGRYQSDGRGTSWLKIKNADYSQIQGRHELFDARSKRPMLRMMPPNLALQIGVSRRK